MRSYSDRAIIIRRDKFGESDITLTVFTKSHGKKKIIVKGSRKIKSRFMGHAEPFSLVKLIAVSGRSFDIATSLEVEDSFHSLKGDINNLGLISYISEVTDIMTVYDDVNLNIFKLLNSAMNSDLWSGHKNSLRSLFVISILDLTGFLPEVNLCAKCGASDKRLDNFSNYWGGLICPECGQNISGRLKKEILPELKLRFSYVDKFIRKGDHSKIAESLDIKKDNEINKVLDAFINYINERNVKSSKFLKV